jgi:multiple sugar transport system substrate-binding protein
VRARGGAAALVLVAGLLTACGSSSSDEQGPIEVTWWHGQVETQAKVIEELAAEYGKAHPGVKIVPAVGTTNVDDMLQKVQAVLAGGKAPDIAYMYGTWMPHLAKNPKVYDLTATVKAPEFQWDDFWPSERAVSEVNGKVVGIPAVVWSTTWPSSTTRSCSTRPGSPTPPRTGPGTTSEPPRRA